MTDILNKDKYVPDRPAQQVLYYTVNMTKIENFISKVESEVIVAITSGVFPPDPEQEWPVLERLSEKYPELDIDPEEKTSILLHARLFFNAHYN